MIVYRHPNRQRASYRALVRWFGTHPLHVIAARFKGGAQFPLIRGGRG